MTLCRHNIQLSAHL